VKDLDIVIVPAELTIVYEVVYVDALISPVILLLTVVECAPDELTSQVQVVLLLRQNYPP